MAATFWTSFGSAGSGSGASRLTAERCTTDPVGSMTPSPVARGRKTDATYDRWRAARARIDVQPRSNLGQCRALVDLQRDRDAVGR